MNSAKLTEFIVDTHLGVLDPIHANAPPCVVACLTGKICVFLLLTPRCAESAPKQQDRGATRASKGGFSK